MWFASAKPPYGTLDAAERAPSTASKADMCSAKSHVRFAPKSGHWLTSIGCPLSAHKLPSDRPNSHDFLRYWRNILASVAIEASSMLRQTHDKTMVERAARNDRVRRCLAGGVVVFLWIVPPQIGVLAEDDPLQKAVNYLFTGRNNPQDAPEILDRKSCVVVVPDPKSKQSIRYYLGRFRIDTAFINKTYAGSETVYNLDVKGAEVIVEYLDLDKSTVLHGHKSAQISLPGDINQTNTALALIASLCTSGKPKAQ